MGLIPVVGLLPKVAVAYAGTWVIGRTVFLWATEGEQLAASEVRRFYEEALARGQALAERLIARVRPPALPAPEAEQPSADTTPAAEPPGLWQRIRGKLPF